MRRILLLVRLLAVLAYMFLIPAMHTPAQGNPASPPAISVPADPC